MNQITAEQIEDLGKKLVQIAAIFNPESALVIGGVVEAASELNTIVREIRSQSEANAPEVWNQVRKDYGDALNAFNASVQDHPGV